MLKKLSLACFSLLCALAWMPASFAETVMEKAARTGVITVGTRFDLIPYSYVNDQGELVGYSLNVLNLVREEMERQLGKKITLQVVESKDVSDRIAKLQNGEIDIACDTAFTWERDKKVDFSISYSISGIRLLTASNSSLGTPESLADKRIGVMPNTISEQTIKLVQPRATLVPITTVEQGFTALSNGQIDALAGDSVVLDGTRQTMNPNNYKLVPKEPYATYGVACMVPENNSTFVNLLNYTIVKFMQGYLIGSKEPTDMVNRWIGPQGIISIDPKMVKDFFNYQVITHEQIPFK